MTSLEFTSQVQKISLTLRPAAMNLTRDADDAKDLVQETLLKALLNKDKFKAGTNLKAWLYTIMRNTFINNYNKITKRSSNIDSTEYFQYFNTDQNYITHNGATSDFVVRDINEAIAGLGTDYRTPFMMYYIGYKYMEIAEKLQIPIGTVKNRIHIARKDLKAALQVYAPVGASAAGRRRRNPGRLTGPPRRRPPPASAAAFAALGRRFLFGRSSPVQPISVLTAFSLLPSQPPNS